MARVEPKAAPAQEATTERDQPGLMVLNMKELLDTVSCLFSNAAGACENLAAKVAAGEIDADNANQYRRLMRRIVGDVESICQGDVSKLRRDGMPEAWKIETPHDHP